MELRRKYDPDQAAALAAEKRKTLDKLLQSFGNSVDQAREDLRADVREHVAEVTDNYVQVSDFLIVEASMLQKLDAKRDEDVRLANGDQVYINSV